MGELKPDPCPFCCARMVESDALRTRNRAVYVHEPNNGSCPAANMILHSDDHERITAWNTRPRTEGRGDQEPVAWQEAAEPFFRLAREVINPVNGERPWHADSKDWMVVFSFAGQSVTLGDLRRAAVASPIREPEISRTAVEVPDEIEMLRIFKAAGCRTRADFAKAAAKSFADAILNLAPVAKGAGAEPGAGWVYNSPDTGMEYSTEHPLESGEIPDATDVRRSTFFEDWMFGEIGRLDAKVRELVVNLAPDGGRGEGWRPIETAPKDGTRVLAWPGHLAGGVTAAVETWWYEHPSTQGWITDAFDCGDYEFAPTCWAPLPPPPQEQANEESQTNGR